MLYHWPGGNEVIGEPWLDAADAAIAVNDAGQHTVVVTDFHEVATIPASVQFIESTPVAKDSCGSATTIADDLHSELSFSPVQDQAAASTGQSADTDAGSESTVIAGVISLVRPATDSIGPLATSPCQHVAVLGSITGSSPEAVSRSHVMAVAETTAVDLSTGARKRPDAASVRSVITEVPLLTSDASDAASGLLLPRKTAGWAQVLRHHVTDSTTAVAIWEPTLFGALASGLQKPVFEAQPGIIQTRASKTAAHRVVVDDDSALVSGGPEEAFKDEAAAAAAALEADIYAESDRLHSSVGAAVALGDGSSAVPMHQPHADSSSKALTQPVAAALANLNGAALQLELVSTDPALQYWGQDSETPGPPTTSASASAIAAAAHCTEGVFAEQSIVAAHPEDFGDSDDAAHPEDFGDSDDAALATELAAMMTLVAHDQTLHSAPQPDLTLSTQMSKLLHAQGTTASSRSEEGSHTTAAPLHPSHAARHPLHTSTGQVVPGSAESAPAAALCRQGQNLSPLQGSSTNCDGACMRTSLEAVLSPSALHAVLAEVSWRIIMAWPPPISGAGELQLALSVVQAT